MKLPINVIVIQTHSLKNGHLYICKFILYKKAVIKSLTLSSYKCQVRKLLLHKKYKLVFSTTYTCSYHSQFHVTE